MLIRRGKKIATMGRRVVPKIYGEVNFRSNIYIEGNGNVVLYIRVVYQAKASNFTP